MIVVAVASGTSADALDVAVVEIQWDGDEGVRLRPLHLAEHPWPAGLRDRLLALLPPSGTSAREMALLDTAIGRVVGEVAAAAIAEARVVADLIVSPGQTVHHEVAADRCLATLQLGQPAWVAERTGVAVLSDLRARDVAAGGHGAPLAGTFDALWLAPGQAALNLGGIANLTVRRAGDVVAFDTGPASCLLDLVAVRATTSGQAYDVDGRLARAGSVRPDLLDAMLRDPYFALAPPKSTGREHFGTDWLDARLEGARAIGWEDLAATLTELSARSVAAAVQSYDVVELLVSGGGTRNPELMRRLRDATPRVTVVDTGSRGVDPDAKEVLMWALVGFLSWHGLPGTVTTGDGRTTTGASGPRVLGRLTPGAQPLRMPDPSATPVRALRLV